MQTSEAIEIMARVVAIWPQPSMTEATINEYVGSIVDLPATQVLMAIEELRVTSNFLPRIADLRQAAIEANPGARVPEADDAWLQVKSEIRRVGTKRGTMDFRTGQPFQTMFSHPAIAAAVRSMGWEELCASENEVADRAHFLKLYSDAAGRSRREAAMTPAGRDLLNTLTASIATPIAKTGK